LLPRTLPSTLRVNGTPRTALRLKLVEPCVVPSNSVSAGRPPVVDSYPVLSLVASPRVEKTMLEQSPLPCPWLTRRRIEPGTAPSSTNQRFQIRTPNMLNETMYVVSALSAAVISNWCAKVNVAVTTTGTGPQAPSGNAPVELGRYRQRSSSSR